MLLDRALDARDARRKAYREEGRAEREQEMRQELTAWYERLEAARREGTPFDEPPPFIEANGRSDNGRPA